MMHASDTQFIVDALYARFAELVAYLYPGAFETKGRVYPSAKGNKDLGSFEIVVQGSKAGSWYRHSQGVGGGPLALIAYTLTGSTVVDRTTFDEARRFLGIDTAPVDPAEQRRRAEKAERDRRHRDEAIARQRAQEAEDEAKRQESAADLWDAATPIDGTPGEAYLRGRGLDLPTWPSELRYLARCRHVSGSWSGAIIARVLSQAGAFSGVWRIYVTDKGTKAFGADSKRGLGPTAGGAVRLFAPQDGAIGICEGVETGLAIRALSRGAVGIWAGLSTSGVAGFEPPFEVSRVLIYPDGDLSRWDAKRGIWTQPPGSSAARRLFDRMGEEGISCSIQPRPTGKRDFLDTYVSLREKGLLP